MEPIEVDEAEAQFLELIARVEAGEEIVIARNKQPVARMTALPVAKKPLFGALAGRYPPIPDAFFFDPLPDDELRLWEGGTEDSSR